MNPNQMITTEDNSAIKANQRLHERHKIHWPVEIKRKFSDGIETRHGHTGDVSLGGMSLFLDVNVTPGEVVYLRLKVQPCGGNMHTFDIEIIARVVHVNYSSSAYEYELGIQFQNFKDEGAKRLKEVLNLVENETAAKGVKVVKGIL